MTDKNVRLKPQPVLPFGKASRLKDLIASDFYKIFHMKSVFIALIVMLALILINYALFWVQNSFTPMMPGMGNPPTITPGDDVTAIFFVTTGRTMLFGAGSYIALGLFIGIIFGLNVGGEFSNGTSRLILARGTNRNAMYFSKWLVMATLVVMYISFAFLVCGILTAISGYGSSVETLHFAWLDFAYLIRAYLAQIFCQLAICSIMLMLCFLIRSKGAAVGVSLAVFILSNMIIGILLMISLVDPPNTSWLEDVVGYLPSQLLGRAGDFNLSNSAINQNSVINQIQLAFMPLVFIFGASAIGMAVLNKKDVK